MRGMHRSCSSYATFVGVTLWAARPCDLWFVDWLTAGSIVLQEKIGSFLLCANRFQGKLPVLHYTGMSPNGAMDPKELTC